LRLWKNNFILISATDTVVKVFLVIFTVAVILYYIWALIVAKNAIKEIKDDQKKNSPKPMVLPPQDTNDGQQIGNQVIIGV
jgi:cell division protein FtsN